MVFDVNLGIDLDQLITESAKELTKDAKKELDEAIAVMESAKRLKEESEKEKLAQVNNIENTLSKVYDELVIAGPNGISVKVVTEKVKTFIPNSSAFSLRMGNFLSKKGNPYRLVRLKINGEPHYVFTPFNQT